MLTLLRATFLLEAELGSKYGTTSLERDSKLLDITQFCMITS